MPSSISNFKDYLRRKAKAAWALGGFLAVFGTCLGAGQWLLAHKPFWAVRDPIPGGDRVFDQSVLFQTIDQPYTTEFSFYHGIGPAISWARRADVLVVGNSLPLFDLRGPGIEEGSRKSGLTFFNLSEPRNNFVFVEQLFQRQHLAPRWVLVNVENFFDTPLHEVLKTTLRKTDWQCREEVYTHSFSWFVKYMIEKWVPRLTFFGEKGKMVSYYVRSAKDGFLLDASYGERRDPLDPPAGPTAEIPPIYLERAKAFKAEMERRGSRLVFIQVPSRMDPRFTKEFARKLGVPFLAPRLAGLKSFDGLHLAPESAEVFTKAFFEEFSKLPDVQKVKR